MSFEGAFQYLRGSCMAQLMGKERNVPLEERSNRELHFWDDEVCKHAICGLCPYTLFSNTKSFLGVLTCPLS